MKTFQRSTSCGGLIAASCAKGDLATGGGLAIAAAWGAACLCATGFASADPQTTHSAIDNAPPIVARRISACAWWWCVWAAVALPDKAGNPAAAVAVAVPRRILPAGAGAD